MAEFTNLITLAQEVRRSLEVSNAFLKGISALLFSISPRESLGFCTTLIFVWLSIQSLVAKDKESMLRVGGLMLIAAFALFSNNAWVYGLAILIAGTTVTSQEFLKSVAAIVFKDSNYFSHVVQLATVKQATLTDREAAEEIRKKDTIIELDQLETMELEPAFNLILTKEGESVKGRSPKWEYYLKIEKLSVMMLNQLYQGKVEHHVRFTDNRANKAVFDGLIETDEEFVISEVNFIPVKGGTFSTDVFTWTVKIKSQLEQAAYFGPLVSKKRLVFHLVVVGQFLVTERLKIQAAFHKYVEVRARELQNIEARLDIFTFEEIYSLDEKKAAAP